MDTPSENIQVDADSGDISTFVNTCGSGQCYYHMNDEYIEWLEESTDYGDKDPEFKNGSFEHFDNDVVSCQA